jgi:hypothetical protein
MGFPFSSFFNLAKFHPKRFRDFAVKLAGLNLHMEEHLGKNRSRPGLGRTA